MYLTFETKNVHGLQYVNPVPHKSRKITWLGVRLARVSRSIYNWLSDRCSCFSSFRHRPLGDGDSAVILLKGSFA